MFSLLILRLMLLFVVLVVVLVPFTLFTRQPISPLMLISGTLRLFSPMVAVVVVVVMDVADTSVVVRVDADVV